MQKTGARLLTVNGSEKKQFVLVHGAWHGAWCWEKVTPLLTGAGHGVHTLDLPGLGSDPTPVAEITLDSYVNAVRDLILEIGESVILVGHSMGGLIITQTAELVPDKVRALGYLAAFSPADGETLFQHAMADTASHVTRFNQVNEAEGYFTIPPDKLPECFYGLCSEGDTNNAIARLRPQPLAPLVQPVHITPENYGRVRRCYIECTKDQALTWPMQQQMQKKARLDALLTLETDHSPFYSCPEDLVDCLVRL